MKIINFSTTLTKMVLKLIKISINPNTQIKLLQFLIIFSFGVSLLAQSYPTPGLPIPAGKSIVITCNVDMKANACPNGIIPSANLSNQSNVTGRNFTMVHAGNPYIQDAVN